jgi:hypothetical protein
MEIFFLLSSSSTSFWRRRKKKERNFTNKTVRCHVWCLKLSESRKIFSSFLFMMNRWWSLSGWPRENPFFLPTHDDDNDKQHIFFFAWKGETNIIIEAIITGRWLFAVYLRLPHHSIGKRLKCYCQLFFSSNSLYFYCVVISFLVFNFDDSRLFFQRNSFARDGFFRIRSYFLLSANKQGAEEETT